MGHERRSPVPQNQCPLCGTAHLAPLPLPHSPCSKGGHLPVPCLSPLSWTSPSVRSPQTSQVRLHRTLAGKVRHQPHLRRPLTQHQGA